MGEFTDIFDFYNSNIRSIDANLDRYLQSINTPTGNSKPGKPTVMGRLFGAQIKPQKLSFWEKSKKLMESFVTL
jgi:hypothetical protein